MPCAPTMRDGTVYNPQHLDEFQEMKPKWNYGFISIAATIVLHIMIIINIFNKEKSRRKTYY